MNRHACTLERAKEELQSLGYRLANWLELFQFAEQHYLKMFPNTELAGDEIVDRIVNNCVEAPESAKRDLSGQCYKITGLLSRVSFFKDVKGKKGFRLGSITLAGLSDNTVERYMPIGNSFFWQKFVVTRLPV